MDCIKWLKKLNNMMKGSKLLDVKRHLKKTLTLNTNWFMIRNSIEKYKKAPHPVLYKLLIDLIQNQILMVIHVREIKKLSAA